MTASSRTSAFTAELQAQSSCAQRTTGIQQIWNIHKQKWTTDAWLYSIPLATHNPSKKILPSSRRKKKVNIQVKQTQLEPEALLGWGVLVCKWFTGCFHWVIEKKNGLLLEKIIRCQEKKNEFTMKSIFCG